MLAVSYSHKHTFLRCSQSYSAAVAHLPMPALTCEADRPADTLRETKNGFTNFLRSSQQNPCLMGMQDTMPQKRLGAQSLQLRHRQVITAASFKPATTCGSSPARRSGGPLMQNPAQDNSSTIQREPHGLMHT